MSIIWKLGLDLWLLINICQRISLEPKSANVLKSVVAGILTHIKASRLSGLGKSDNKFELIMAGVDI